MITFNGSGQKISSFINRIKEGPVFLKSKLVVQSTPYALDSVATLSLAGMAADRNSKLLVGAGVVASGVAMVASSPVVVKLAVATGGACFLSGAIRGWKKAMSET